MKKLSSLLLALAMMATSITAFAAKPEDAVAPKGVVSIEDSGERDGELALYYATIDLSGIGSLTHEKISATKFSGTKVVQYTLEIKGDDLAFAEVSDATFGATAFAQTADATADSPAGFNGIQLVYGNTTAKTAYPTVSDNTGAVKAACVMAFYGVPGAKVTLGASQIGYASFTENKMVGAIERLDVTYDVTEFTLPGGETAELTAEVADITGAGVTTGKAWKVSGKTDGTNAVTGLDVKFVSGKDSLERSVKDMPEITGATYEINVGLLTKKTIDSASFTVADAADATATATWNK